MKCVTRTKETMVKNEKEERKQLTLGLNVRGGGGDPCKSLFHKVSVLEEKLTD